MWCHQHNFQKYTNLLELATYLCKELVQSYVGTVPVTPLVLYCASTTTSSMSICHEGNTSSITPKSRDGNGDAIPRFPLGGPELEAQVAEEVTGGR